MTDRDLQAALSCEGGKAGTDEALGGRYFWVSDGLIVRDRGIDSMTGVIAGLIENGEFSQVFQRVIND